MFEDSFLDSFMESHIGNWTGDEDRYYCDEADEAESYCDYDAANEWTAEQDYYDHEMDEEDDDPPEYPGLDDQHDY